MLESAVTRLIAAPHVFRLHRACPAAGSTMALFTYLAGLPHRLMASNTLTKQEKCYNPLDLTFKFVDREDDLDFLYEGFKSLRAQMSCGHAVTPTSLTNWCRRLLDQGESRFVCGAFGCSAEWTLAEVCKMALLDPQETEYFRKTLEFNAARQMLITRFCPGCGSAVTRKNGSDLNVLCKVCTAVKGQTFEFCWQCLKEWKGARPRKDRCGNRGCCNQSLKTLKECPDIIFDSVKGVDGCPSVRACPTCGLLLEHSKRHCKSLVCPRCKVKFCFVCLKIFTECTTTSGISAPCSSGVAPRQTSIPVWQKK
ncbi:probable E3 ubiquitin-protein ligase ARI8 [Simochromis diagramma]|uniref:probable E3 ubiquitin-protein ligase ARI8 n=1 Tax=Simochromis diagramma TaxID=43689 RepID=UPI001A7E81F8|nr:probable E3 ubiquitin-protein ligase ARI8 [Simochromis diagramma]